MRRTGAPVSHGDPSTDLWPTPADLADAPELAILAALDDILDLTVPNAPTGCANPRAPHTPPTSSSHGPRA
jgi:hypothetical protein